MVSFPSDVVSSSLRLRCEPDILVLYSKQVHQLARIGAMLRWRKSFSEQHIFIAHFDICGALFYNNSRLILFVHACRLNSLPHSVKKHTGGAHPCRSHSTLRLYASTLPMAVLS